MFGYRIERYPHPPRTTKDNATKNHNAHRDSVNRSLANYSLRYTQGGTIIGIQLAPTVASLEDNIRSRNWRSLETEYQRAFEGIRSDPPQAVTAACAILEAICKIYLEVEGLALPPTQTLQHLWPPVQRSLSLDPASIEEDDLKKILQGLTSIATGIAHFRTHTGSAHGRGLRPYRAEERHAYLAVGSAHTLAQFIIQTWDVRRAAAGR